MIKREKVGLAFAQRMGSSTCGTRFDFRLTVLVLVHMVHTPGFYLRSGTRLQASSHRSSSALGDYCSTQTK